MKTLYLVACFCLVSNFVWSQKMEELANVKLENAEDCKKAEPYALKASTFLLSNPHAIDNLDRLKSLQFLIKWMSGTPDYKFAIDEVAGKITKGNEDLLGLYLAAMTKFALENKKEANNQDAVKLNSIKSLITYCENASNNMKMTKALKKLAEANTKGQLEQELAKL